MKEYLFFSNRFSREIKVVFNAQDALIYFEILNADDIVVSKSNSVSISPLREQFLKDMAELKIKVTELDRKISFDMFWDKYNYKDSGRKKAEEAWNKLNKEDQIKAFDYSSVLDRKLKMGAIAKPYATTYLNQKRWEQ
jgi:hypothetical protein